MRVMTVVRSIIAELGGPTAISLETGIPVQTVSDWGVNGNIPHWRRDALVALARRLNKPLDSEMVAYLASSNRAPREDEAAAEARAA